MRCNGPKPNVCVFQTISGVGFVSVNCGADATGALGLSRDEVPPDGVLLLAPDMRTPAATATAKLKYAGALLADMILRLLSS
ncbi:protein of unknown function [Caballeronia sp. S22]